jgi:hypothetical protein
LTSTANPTPIPVVACLSAPVPAGATREQVHAAFASTLDYNGAMDDILQKYYTYDEASRRLGSVYLWCSREAAQQFFAPGWDEHFAKKWGTRPSLSLADALLVLRPLATGTAALTVPAP